MDPRATAPLMLWGDGVWHAPAGDHSYLRFDLDAIRVQRLGTAQLVKDLALYLPRCAVVGNGDTITEAV
jgi:hypothetical protein